MASDHLRTTESAHFSTPANRIGHCSRRSHHAEIRSPSFFNHTWQYKDDPWWVEHIFPIKAEKWNRDLRSEGIDSDTMAVRLHALGNLTALPRGVNASVSNNRYDEKKAAISSNVDAASPKLQEWLSNDFWTPKLIDARTSRILERLKDRWPD